MLKSACGSVSDWLMWGRVLHVSRQFANGLGLSHKFEFDQSQLSNHLTDGSFRHPPATTPTSGGAGHRQPTPVARWTVVFMQSSRPLSNFPLGWPWGATKFSNILHASTACSDHAAHTGWHSAVVRHSELCSMTIDSSWHGNHALGYTQVLVLTLASFIYIYVG
jgi:hypothetical protein